jgi:aquaporin Z
MNSLAILSEFFGTFLLLIAILATGNAFVIGGTLALVILLTGSISGGHMNPAVSATLWIKGAISLTEFLTYITAQYTGGIAAYYAYNALA